MKILNLKHHFFLPLLCLCVYALLPNLLDSSLAYGQEVPSHWQFSTLRTPHFDVIFKDGQMDLARHYAEKLEYAHIQLHRWFTDFPERTIVLIQDTTDQTNGYAAQVPYPHIVVYPVLPPSSDSLSEYADWSTTLLGHEYTHIVSFAPARGVMAGLRRVFGNVVAPNLFLPNWWKEGIAVDLETHLTNKGRPRTLFQEAVIRTQVQTSVLKDNTVSDANENLPSWPEGMRPYLFGSIFWSHVTETKPEGTHAALANRHGSRIPYFIEGPAYEALKSDYTDFYDQSLDQIQKRAEYQLTQINQLSPTATKELAQQEQYSHFPSVDSSGKYLAFVSVDETDKRKIRIFEKIKTEWAPIQSQQDISSDYDPHYKSDPDAPPTGSINSLKWMNQSTRLLFDKITPFSSTEAYSDLYVYDLKSSHTDRLTIGARLREPSSDESDSRIVAVQLLPAKTALALFDLKTKSISTEWISDWGERISSPIFLNKDEILFSLTRQSGNEEIMVFSLTDKTKRPRLFLPDHSLAKRPMIKGKFLYFISGKNRIWNLYRTSLDIKSPAEAITHLDSGIMSYAIQDAEKGSSPTAIASLMTAKGERLFELSTSSFGKNALPVVSPLVDASKYYHTDQRFNDEASTTNSKIDSGSWQTEEYSSGSYLWPQYWIPFLATNPNGGWLLQAITSGFDPLKYHVYTAQLNWDTALQKASFLGSYTNSTLPWSWGLQYSQINSYFSVIQNSYTDDNVLAFTEPDVFAIDKNLKVVLAWKYQSRDFSGTVMKRSGPSLLVSHTDYSRSGAQISPEEGHSLYAGWTQYLPGQQNLSHGLAIAGGSLYWSRFLPARHSILLKAQGFYVPEKISAYYGTQTDSYQALQDSPQPLYLLRGLSTGQVFGSQLYSTNLEYRMPILDLNRGNGTYPYYLRRLYGAAIWDAVTAKGGVYERDLVRSTDLGEVYQSFGAELHLEATLGYVLPLNFVLGLYRPTPQLARDGVSVGLSVQFSNWPTKLGLD